MGEIDKSCSNLIIYFLILFLCLKVKEDNQEIASMERKYVTIL